MRVDSWSLPAIVIECQHCGRCKEWSRAKFLSEFNDMMLPDVLRAVAQNNVMHSIPVETTRMQRQTASLSGVNRLAVLDEHVQRAAYELGLSFENCLLCRHGRLSQKITASLRFEMFCEQGHGKKGTVGVNAAVSCPSYDRCNSLEELRSARDIKSAEPPIPPAKPMRRFQKHRPPVDFE